MPPVSDNDQSDSEVVSSDLPEASEPSMPAPTEAVDSSSEEGHEEPISDPPVPAEAAPDEPTTAPDAPLSPEQVPEESASDSESIPVTVSTSAPSSPPIEAEKVAATSPADPISVSPVAAAQPSTPASKSYRLTVVLSFLVGVLGIDRFYLGKTGTGVLKLVTFGGLGFWYIYDLVMTASNRQTDSNGKLLSGYDQYKVLGYILVVLLVIAFISGIALLN
jgi:outer membrane biosynthesis protein TonB